jgi:hypothetical protein
MYRSLGTATLTHTFQAPPSAEWAGRVMRNRLTSACLGRRVARRIVVTSWSYFGCKWVVFGWSCSSSRPFFLFISLPNKTYNRLLRSQPSHTFCKATRRIQRRHTTHYISPIDRDSARATIKCFPAQINHEDVVAESTLRVRNAGTARYAHRKRHKITITANILFRCTTIDDHHHTHPSSRNPSTSEGPQRGSFNMQSIKQNRALRHEEVYDVALHTKNAKHVLIILATELGNYILLANDANRPKCRASLGFA